MPEYTEDTELHRKYGITVIITYTIRS